VFLLMYAAMLVLLGGPLLLLEFFYGQYTGKHDSAKIKIKIKLYLFRNCFSLNANVFLVLVCNVS
jgi:SNF family Na+-dependent transporter